MRVCTWASAALCSLIVAGCSAVPSTDQSTNAGAGGAGGTAASSGGAGAVANPSGGASVAQGGSPAGGGSSTGAASGAAGAPNSGGSSAGTDSGAGGSLSNAGSGGFPGAGSPASGGASGSAGSTASAGSGGSAGSVGSAGSAGSGTPNPQAIDVYILAGQSNATGQGYVKNLPAGFAIDTRVKLYHSGSPNLNSGSTANAWIPLRQASESSDRFGPELGFGNRIQALYPNRKVAIIKHARSNTNLYSQWAPGTSKTSRTGWGELYGILVDTVTPALSGLKNQGLNPVVRGMLWQQGEADADAGGSSAENYGRNLNAFIARVRDQFDAPGMFFVYGYVYPPPNSSASIEIVRRGESQVDEASGNALAMTGAYVIPTDDLQQRADEPNSPYPDDHIHFGTDGILELGKRMAEKLYSKLGP